MRAFIFLLADSLLVRIFGIPKIPAKNHTELATKVLQYNYQPPLCIAGMGHYRYLWISDFAVAIRSYLTILPKEDIKKIIEHIISCSKKFGTIPAACDKTSGFDIPYARADSIPWFFHIVNEYMVKYHDKNFLQIHKEYLQILFNKYLNDYVSDDTGLLKNIAIGDWIDTIRRPSSTCNNLLFLHMIHCASMLHIHSKITKKQCEDSLLSRRYKKDYFTEDAHNNDPSIDATAFALYLQLFSKRIRKKLADYIRKQDIWKPTPIKVFYTKPLASSIPWITKLFAYNYHSKARWLHLGLMLLIGLKSIKMVTPNKINAVDKIIERYNNFIETTDEKGKAFMGILSTEYGFTMSAALYVELVKNLS